MKKTKTSDTTIEELSKEVMVRVLENRLHGVSDYARGYMDALRLAISIRRTAMKESK